MFIFEYLKIIIATAAYFSLALGAAVIFLSFFGNMEIVYKAKILDSPPTPWWTRVLNRLTWGLNGLGAVYNVLTNRKRLFRTVLLMEAKEDTPEGLLATGGLPYAPTTTGYAPMPGTILLFHGNSEDEGEPLYVLRPFEFLAEDWRAAIGRGV